MLYNIYIIYAKILPQQRKHTLEKDEEELR